MKKILARPYSTNKVQKKLSHPFLRMMGWKAEGRAPDSPKYVLILAPHTSNWDLFLILAVLHALGIKLYWFGKKELFRWPVGSLFKWLGGIPVVRSSRENMVQKTVEIIQSREEIIIGVAPEGTRSNSKYWRTGFYHIAHQAQIPIAFAFLDYRRRVGGIGPSLIPTGDIEKDMKIIRQFYSGVTAKFPHEMGEIAFKPQDEIQQK